MSGIQDFLMDQVKNAVLNHSNQQGTGFDPSELIQQISGAASQGNIDPNHIAGLIQNHANDQSHTGFDPGPLISQVQNMFGMHQQAQQNNEGQYGNVKSSNEDPYGDPADEQGNFGNVKSSNEDPYGDPADEEQNARR